MLLILAIQVSNDLSFLELQVNNDLHVRALNVNNDQPVLALQVKKGLPDLAPFINNGLNFFLLSKSFSKYSKNSTKVLFSLSGARAV